MEISIVTIYCENDTDYIKHLIPTIPKECEIVMIKTIPISDETIVNYANDIKQENNIIYGNYYYKGSFNFAEARNFAKNFATKEWIFSLDADEYLSPRAFKLADEITHSIDNKIGGIICGLADVIPNETTNVIKVMRLFRNKKDILWEFGCHEQIYDNIVNAGYQIAESNLLIEHTGYNIDRAGLRSKMERNFDLLCIEYGRQINDDKKNYIKKHIIESSLKLFQLNEEN